MLRGAFWRKKMAKVRILSLPPQILKVLKIYISYSLWCWGVSIKSVSFLPPSFASCFNSSQLFKPEMWNSSENAKYIRKLFYLRRRKNCICRYDFSIGKNVKYIKKLLYIKLFKPWMWNSSENPNIYQNAFLFEKINLVFVGIIFVLYYIIFKTLLNFMFFFNF